MTGRQSGTSPDSLNRVCAAPTVITPGSVQPEKGVGLSIAGGVAADLALLAARVELHPRVDTAVELRVLLLAEHHVALAVEVPEVGLAVAALVDLGADELALFEELAPALLRISASRDHAADEHAALIPRPLA